MKKAVQDLRSNLDQLKDCTSATLLLGIHAYRRKQWSKAQAYFENACEKHPCNSLAHYKIGMCHFNRKDWNLAATSMARALELSPSQTKWRVQYLDVLSKQAIKEKKWIDAEARIKELIEINIDKDVRKSANLHRLLAIVLRKQGKWWQVVEALKTATTLDPEHALWWHELGQAQEATGHFQSAAISLKEAIRLKGEKTEAIWHYQEGYCLARKGQDGPANPNAAEIAYQKAIENDVKKNAKRFGIGVFHQQSGRWAEAAREYKKKLRESPSAELWYRLGMAHDRCYEWDQAEIHFSSALLLDSTQPYWHYRLGLALEGQGKYDEAAQAYHYALIHANQHNPYWFYRLGYVLEQQGSYQAAAQVYLKTRLQQTLDPQVDKDLLSGYRKSLGSRFQEAVKLLLVEDKTKAKSWYQLGNCHEMMEDWINAAKAYQYALARNNDYNPEWFHRLGFTLVKLGEYQKACQSFRYLEIQQEFLGASQSSNESSAYLLNTHYINAREGQQLKNTVLIECFNGTSFTCNPYAIFKEMWKDERFKHWDFVITIKDPQLIPAEYKQADNFILVKKNSFLYTQCLATSRILINNLTFPIYFIKREGQIYVNTWHGTPWKMLGIYNPMQNGNTARNFIHSNYLISPNPHTSNVLLDHYGITGLFQGEVAEIGYPRIDLLINASTASKQSLKEQLGITDGRPIILFAPTYRGFWKDPDIEADNLIKVINGIQSEDYHLIFRGHYFAEEKIKSLGLDVTIAEHIIDSCELLSIVDILISDYSSIIFDFLVAKKPIILHIPDVDEYKIERGLYFEPSRVPGYPTRDLPELKSAIQGSIEFPQEKIEGLGKFLPIYAPYEDGKASSRILEKISRSLSITSGYKMNTENSLATRTLVYPGTIEKLETMQDLKEYLEEALPPDSQVAFIFNKGELAGSIDLYHLLMTFPGACAQVEYCGQVVTTIYERWLLNKHLRDGYNPSTQTNLVLSKIYEREWQRLFGSNHFNDFIVYGLESSFWSRMKDSLAAENRKNL